tara:strand:- start:64 stop:519 length:456 start_codon:yes stop_codon:yes gene_type:complete
MTIDSSGRITTPARPSWSAYTTSHITSSSTIVFDTVVHNIGSHYNSSNGKFTAPVTGSYLISFKTLIITPNNSSSAVLKINDSDYATSSYAVGNMGTYPKLAGQSAGYYIGQGASIIAYLTANDTAHIYATINGDADMHSGYTSWSGCLIG